MSEFLCLVIYLSGRIGGFYLPATALHFFKNVYISKLDHGVIIFYSNGKNRGSFKFHQYIKCLSLPKASHFLHSCFFFLWDML